MIGAILTTAVFAFLASTLATIGNFAIANIFYFQSLALWGLLVLLVAGKLLSSL
jgi:uncharacterized membrane protein YcfT